MFSIFWRQVSTQENLNPWKNWESWQQNTHGIYNLYNFIFSIDILTPINMIGLVSLLVVTDFLLKKKTTGTSWQPLQTKGSSWTCSLSSSMPRTPWKLVSTLGIHFLPPLSLFLKMERYEKLLLGKTISLCNYTQMGIYLLITSNFGKECPIMAWCVKQQKLSEI